MAVLLEDELDADELDELSDLAGDDEEVVDGLSDFDGGDESEEGVEPFDFSALLGRESLR